MKNSPQCASWPIAFLFVLIGGSFVLAGCASASPDDQNVVETALPTQNEVTPSATQSPAPIQVASSTPTEELCPPDLDYEISTFYDENKDWFVAITSEGEFEIDQYYWCWSEITDKSGCPCEVESASSIVCRVARKTDMESYEAGQSVLIDIGMGGYSDCRLFYETLIIPSFGN